MEENLESEKKFSCPHGWLRLSITRAVLLQGVMRTHIPETLQTTAASPKQLSSSARLETLKISQSVPVAHSIPLHPSHPFNGHLSTRLLSSTRRDGVIQLALVRSRRDAVSSSAPRARFALVRWLVGCWPMVLGTAKSYLARSTQSISSIHQMILSRMSFPPCISAGKLAVCTARRSCCSPSRWLLGVLLGRRHVGRRC